MPWPVMRGPSSGIAATAQMLKTTVISIRARASLSADRTALCMGCALDIA